MSLDVSLRLKNAVRVPAGSGIFIRDDGGNREISREEWNERNPDRQVPILECGEYIETDIVFDANITHNLAEMAEEAGIYKHLWRPEELGVKTAKELIEPLRAGLALLRSDPARFEKYNPENGWGSYESFVPWVQRYLDACESYPEAEVSASR